MKLTWLNDDARLVMKRRYLKEGVSPEERYLRIAETVEEISGLEGIKDRFINYIEKNWVSFATPVLRSFGENDNLSISCNKSIIDDTLDSILSGLHEVGMLSKHGAGTSICFSNIRSIGSNISTGGTSEGIIPFLELYDQLISKVTQGSTRRGACSAYLSVDHPEIMSFLDIRSDGATVKQLLPAVTIPENWIADLKSGDKNKRKIWSKILKMRAEIGFPYILFLDNCNNQKPQIYKDKNLEIKTSNLCNEIIEYCDNEKTFACCLSSVNAYYYDDWKHDPNFIFDMNIMLDCVIEEYINQASKISGLEKAVKFSKEHRAIGLGVMGFHSYLQENMISIGSLKSFAFNNKLFSHIRHLSDKASKWMAKHWGEPEIMKGTGFRNSTRIAVAPTKTTSFIMGQYSLGIEPIKSNIHEKEIAGTSFSYHNKKLAEVLENYGKNTNAVWKSIVSNDGSIQHLDFLSTIEKQVFRTFWEISQIDLIKLAAQRQKYIDQGQSLNLMFDKKASAKDINKIILMAHEEGIKGLYYQFSINAAKDFINNQECSSCEG